MHVFQRSRTFNNHAHVRKQNQLKVNTLSADSCESCVVNRKTSSNTKESAKRSFRSISFILFKNNIRHQQKQFSIVIGPSTAPRIQTSNQTQDQRCNPIIFSVSVCFKLQRVFSAFPWPNPPQNLPSRQKESSSLPGFTRF